MRRNELRRCQIPEASSENKKRGLKPLSIACTSPSQPSQQGNRTSELRGERGKVSIASTVFGCSRETHTQKKTNVQASAMDLLLRSCVVTCCSHVVQFCGHIMRSLIAVYTLCGRLIGGTRCRGSSIASCPSHYYIVGDMMRSLIANATVAI